MLPCQTIKESNTLPVSGSGETRYGAQSTPNLIVILRVPSKDVNPCHIPRAQLLFPRRPKNAKPLIHCCMPRPPVRRVMMETVRSGIRKNSDLPQFPSSLSAFTDGLNSCESSYDTFLGKSYEIEKTFQAAERSRCAAI
jgi:hypothetical protein